MNNKIIKILKKLQPKSLSDWIVYGILVIFLIARGPGIFSQYIKQGNLVEPKILSGRAIPPKDQKSILIFWASWCGPCQVEMQRIQEAIDEKKINPNSVIAVNIGETQAIVEKYFREKKLSYSFVLDNNGELSNDLLVLGTPTVAFIDSDGRVDWLSSGLSPSLIFRMNHFLNP